ncbi:ParB/RepB/Spo0J family partition protein [Enterococcus faecium]|uniref:ParB/RepB/Spo0J family partition protein n=1 Tax=Enterococcus faecium TaxID=1352 RepID=UPI00032E27BB|nr:ParB/RepB/Spo0J family partition protein [Enterococcus faecium]EOH32624.1 ParB-like partition protein [Enterococcus faecium EnGen0185]EOH41600.1 ParB-like partition protein [Enterococcus faecium EnGen0190]
MAKNEPNKPDEVKTTPAQETPANENAAPAPMPEIGGEAPAPEITAEKAVATVHEDKAALHEIGDDTLEPPTPFDIPAPGDVVVSFDKINEIVSGKQAAVKEAEQAPPEKQGAKKSGPADKKAEPEKPGPDKGKENEPKMADSKPKPRQPKATEKADKKPSRPAKQEKQAKAAQADKPTKQKQAAGIGGGSVSGKSTEQPKQETPPPTPVQPPEPREAPRSNEQEQIVYISLAELHPFKGHPFQVRKDEEMAAMVESVKDKGVTQAAIVRPREDGGYEIVSGHRRQMASELAGFTNMPCIVRNLTDEQAITQMVEDNTTQREAILPSERAKALQMQLEAIKKQGARTGNGQRSNEVVAERNKMTIKQVQRYIKLNELVPDLMKMVDEKKIAFTPAVELAFITPKNQRYIAVAIEGQQSAPSLSQAQRMRELDQKNMLKPDTIDGIMLEEKKEVDKVILSSQELGQYFGKEKTPREMKDTIMKLLEENKDKLKDISAPEKKAEQEK